MEVHCPLLTVDVRAPPATATCPSPESTHLVAVNDITQAYLLLHFGKPLNHVLHYVVGQGTLALVLTLQLHLHNLRVLARCYGGVPRRWTCEIPAAVLDTEI